MGCLDIIITVIFIIIIITIAVAAAVSVTSRMSILAYLILSFTFSV